mgnify:CR=1 FL=1
MGGPDAVAGFRASLGDLRKLFSQTSEAADNAQKAQQAREASDAEAGPRMSLVFKRTLQAEVARARR